MKSKIIPRLLIFIVAVLVIAIVGSSFGHQDVKKLEEEGKVIYLTFDDGPGPYTGELLDTLHKYHAKATFFVTAAYPDYEDLIHRAASEGHSIGIHSYSHRYNEIYSCVDAYLSDFYAMDEVIYYETHSHTKLFRFPGGSSNTVSNFNPGIMTELTRLMTQKGYYYFDWNVLSGDAGETTDSFTVYQNVINGCAGKDVSVVLMHDIKPYTVEAMEDILDWGVHNGYRFIALTEDSFSAHHPVNN